MKIHSYYHVESEGEKFFMFDEVNIKTTTGEGRTGRISHITSKGVYLDVGTKNHKHFNFQVIESICGVKG